MRTKVKHRQTDTGTSLWNWKGLGSKKNTAKKQFPVTEFLQENYRKMRETVLGPGGGAGIGCGVGVGFGLVGGVGFGGSSWNQLNLVFGVGMGCGVGVGFGYGQGFGYGFGLDTLESYVSKLDSSDS
ncbi:hypothetical protein Patl1_21403 [Pistacia atlantica]|uniref:Uncharacterized protein n=1 Tax=Pistacia atlantica TaxID=434234 RepID=A0ACC1BI33_9ROSI|nr:hypothetical protein Patl1_21403 [Pistacia atlantica]